MARKLELFCFRPFSGILRVTAARELGMERDSKRAQYKALISQPLGSLWHHAVHGHFLLHLPRQGAMDFEKQQI